MAHWIGSRGRTIVRTGTWSLLAKSSAAAVYLLSIPLAYSALDPVQFGIWATLVSIVSFSNFMDFGIGNGCMNLIASAHGKGDAARAATVFRQGLLVLTAIACALFLASLVGLLAVPGANWVPGGSRGPADIVSSMLLAVGVAVFSAPLSLGLRARLATGRGDSAFRWQAAGHAGALLALFLASSRQPTLLSMTAAALLPPLLASAINALSVGLHRDFRRPLPLTGPERRQIRRAIAREGGLFFVLQLAAALTFSADLLLIAWLRGATEAGNFAVVQRLFSIVPMALSLVWAPLWPIYRSALATGNHAWVARTLRFSTALALGGALLISPLIMASHDHLLDVFAPGHPGASLVLLAGFAIWTCFEAAGTSIATFLNSASVLRFQVVSASVLAIAAVLAKVWVLVAWSPDLLPWATSSVYAAVFVVPLAFFWKSIWAAAMARSY